MNEQKKEAAAQWWAECNKRIYDFPEKPARLIFEQGFVAGQAAQQSGPSPGRALSLVEDAMNAAHDSVILVCCGVCDENGCCGSPEPNWPNSSPMIRPDPVQKELTQILRQIEQKKMAAEQAQEGDKS